MPDDAWTAQVTLLQPGETLMSVSDGVLDCFASPQDALAAAQAWNRESGDAEQLVDRVITACGRGVPEDDVTVVVVRRSA
jgi:serine/threonine protein phosphatase PrpC